MRIAYFDCFSGVSGDMILGALLDLGLDSVALNAMLTSVGIDSFSIVTDRVTRKGISALNLTVKTDSEHHHRSLQDILSMLNTPELSLQVRERIAHIFTRIAEAESKIHRKPAEQIQFHEVGAVDSIIDIIGSIWGMEQLGITQSFSSAISIGSGSVECEHGTIPVPAPATLELIKGFPVVKKEAGTELATPTGAAIITSVAEYSYQMPPMRISAVGYGSGDRDLDAFPNVLRVILGEPETLYEEDRMLVIETNVDDMNTELYPYIMERLLECGAADVFITPILMKKGRPGHMLTILVGREQSDRCLNVLFGETTTLGARVYETYRRKVKRTPETIETPFGAVKVTSYIHNGKKRIVPEFEECKKIAAREHLPLLDIYETIKRIGNSDD